MAGDFRSRDFETQESLLGDFDPAPVVTINPQGRSAFLFIGDHAGNLIPAALGTLGIGETDRRRHIAWDIGVAALGEALAARLDAVFLQQAYSRLVIDCNRDPDSPEAIPEESDGTVIPGNGALTAPARAARIAQIHAPYQLAIATEIARRAKLGIATILVSLHSFTPEIAGDRRPWDIGILHDGANDGFALRLLDHLRTVPGLTVGDNAPYRMDATDHTVPRHAFPALPYAELPYAELELAQRRLEDGTEIGWWCDLLATALSDSA